MTTFPYRIVVEWSQADDAFLARVPALPGCIAHGDTEADAAHEARAAAQAILHASKQHDRPAPPSDLAAD